MNANECFHIRLKMLFLLNLDDECSSYCGKSESAVLNFGLPPIKGNDICLRLRLVQTEPRVSPRHWSKITAVAYRNFPHSWDLSVWHWNTVEIPKFVCENPYNIYEQIFWQKVAACWKIAKNKFWRTKLWRSVYHFKIFAKNPCSKFWLWGKCKSLGRPWYSFIKWKYFICRGRYSSRRLARFADSQIFSGRWANDTFAEFKLRG